MTTQELTPLFAEPQEGEAQWTLPLETRLGPLSIPLIKRQIVQEIKDQCEIKSSQRKAILRATQKAQVRCHKRGIGNLSDQEVEQYKWNLFIVRVDEAIKGRHAEIKANPDLAETIAQEGHFGTD